MTELDFKSNRGSALLRLFDFPTLAIVTATYPDFEFLPWFFTQIPTNYFKNKENRVKYMNWLMKKIGVSNYSELKFSHFEENGGQSLLRMFNGSPKEIIDSLKDTSEMDHNNQNISKGKKPKQYWVFSSFFLFLYLSPFHFISLFLFCLFDVFYSIFIFRSFSLFMTPLLACLLRVLLSLFLFFFSFFIFILLYFISFHFRIPWIIKDIS